MLTLGEMIENAVSGDDDETATLPPASAATRTTKKGTEASETVDFDTADAEKLASFLEFIGRRGVENMLDKQAGAMETNAGQNHKSTVKRQVMPHSGAPPMSAGGAGKVENNEGTKPGGGREQGDTSGKGARTHHPALASNEAAINYTKKVKAQQESPQISAVLDTTPYADPKLKELLDNDETDKNIHSKGAHDKEAIRAEILRRAARNKTGQGQREVADA